MLTTTTGAQATFLIIYFAAAGVAIVCMCTSA